MGGVGGLGCWNYCLEHGETNVRVVIGEWSICSFTHHQLYLFQIARFPVLVVSFRRCGLPGLSIGCADSEINCLSFEKLIVFAPYFAA